MDNLSLTASKLREHLPFPRCSVSQVLYKMRGSHPLASCRAPHHDSAGTKMATACRMAGKAYFTMKVVVFSTVVLSISFYIGLPLFRSFVGQGMEFFVTAP